MSLGIIFKDFVALFFPNYCVACIAPLAKGEKHICTKCVFELPKTNYHLEKENPISNRFYGKIEVKYVFSYLKFFKKGITQKLLHKIKYENQPEIAEMLGKWYGVDLKEIGMSDQFDLIVPVPLYKSKKRKRGYNQSDAIAKGLSESLGVPWSDRIVKRVVKSQTQAKKKDRLARWENVKNIFDVKNVEEVTGKRVLIVDDILTSGATLEACAIPFVKAGCEVSFMTLAVAQ